MTTARLALTVGLVFGTLSATGYAQERGDDDKPMPAERTKRLLERYGADGIDANGDGALTQSEIRKFFADRPARPRRRGAEGANRMRGQRRGPANGPRVGVMRLIDRLDALSTQPIPTEESASFRRADSDRDGQVTAAEWQTFQGTTRDRMLDRLLKTMPDADTDKDGKLSDTEMATLRETLDAERRAAVLERNPEADTNGDGTLSASEFEAHNTARRAEMLKKNPAADLDGDGVLSEEEARKLNQGRRGRRGAAREMDQRRPRRGGKGRRERGERGKPVETEGTDDE